MKSRTPAGSHRKVAALAAVAVATLLAFAFAVAVSGCAEEQSGGAVTTASGTSVGPSVGSSSTSVGDSTTTTLPELLSEWDRELAETAQAQNRLAAYLNEQGATQDDPRLAVIFGLRARTQAITGRQALDQGDLGLADMAMKDVYPTLNLGRNLAEGSVSQILEDAYSAVEKLGIPSEKPGEAAGSLDRFIASLRPLLDEAKALVPEN